MSILSIAERVAARRYSAVTCGHCGSTMQYDDGRDAYVCTSCGFKGPNGPADFQGVIAARRKKKRPKKSILKPQIEYAVQSELILSAEFEGNVSKPTLIKKLKSEIMASLEGAVKITARELRLDSMGLTIKPLHFEVAVNDQSSEDEED